MLWSIFVVEMHNSVIFNNHAKSFGTYSAKLDSREVKTETQSLCPFSITISHVVDKLFTIEFISKGSNHEWIVDGHGNDFICTTLLNLIGTSDVTWNV